MASLTRKIIHGRPYYYLRETARVQGRSKVVRTTYLGRAEDIESRLVGVAEPKAVVVGSFGAVAAAWKVCEELQVAQAIDRALGARRGSGLSVGEMITLAAINRACAPRSKRQLGDWHARTALCRLMPAPRRSLSSQRFWDAMHVLSDEAVAAAETEIVRRAIERYQIELRRSRLCDLRLTDEELAQLTLVYDKGNNSKTNQPLADELGLDVVGSLSPSKHPELLDIELQRFKELKEMAGTLAYRTSMEVYGRQRTIVVSYSERFAAKQQRSFAQTLSKAQRELSELRGIVQRGKHRMDERALTERISKTLKRRWLKDVIT